MVNVTYICNGCGMYLTFNERYDQKINQVEIDLTNYLILSAGVVLKEPRMKIHFCSDCYSQIYENGHSLSILGGESLERIRRDYEKANEEKARVEREFNYYKAKVADILRQGLQQ